MNNCDSSTIFVKPDDGVDNVPGCEVETSGIIVENPGTSVASAGCRLGKLHAKVKMIMSEASSNTGLCFWSLCRTFNFFLDEKPIPTLILVLWNMNFMFKSYYTYISRYLMTENGKEKK